MNNMSDNGLVERLIGKERCPCGHPSCTTWFLTGIGSFVQGSGFTEVEADRIIQALQTPPKAVSGDAVEAVALAMAHVIAKRHNKDREADRIDVEFWLTDARREEARAAIAAYQSPTADEVARLREALEEICTQADQARLLLIHRRAFEPPMTDSYRDGLIEGLTRARAIALAALTTSQETGG